MKTTLRGHHFCSTSIHKHRCCSPWGQLLAMEKWATDSISQISNFLFLVQTSLFCPICIQLPTWTSITGPAYRNLPLSLLPSPVSPWLQRLASSSTEHCKWITYQSFVICLLVAKSNWINFLHTSCSFLPPPWLRSYYFFSLNYCNICISVSVLLTLTYHVIMFLKILSRASPSPKVKILSL